MQWSSSYEGVNWTMTHIRPSHYGRSYVSAPTAIDRYHELSGLVMRGDRIKDTNESPTPSG